MTAFRKALFVTPFAPTPPDEGHRKRMTATLGALRTLGYRVDMLFLALEHAWLDLYDAARFRALHDMVDTFHFVRGAHPPRLETGSYGIDDWWHPAFDDYAAWLFRNVAYELVLTNYVFTSRVLLHARPSAVRLIDTHDRFADRRAMLEARDLRVEFFHTDLDGEAAGLGRADLVLAIKPEEAAAFGACTATPVLTLPYVEPTQPGVERLASPAAPHFGYFASRNQINVRNFLDFADVAAAVAPGVDLVAYGSICDVLAEDGAGRFRRGGRVATPAEFYAAVDCVVVPQRFSTGLKIKVGEALAFGRPLICHAHAFEGFGAPLHPAQACADFAEMGAWMRRFATEPALAAELAAATVAVQKRQSDVVAAGVAEIGRLVAAARDNLLVLVDAAALAADPLYRLVVEGATAAFSDRWRPVLAAPGADAAALGEAALVGGATTLLTPDDPAALGDPGRCGFAFKAALVLGRQPAPELGGAPVFTAPDIAAYLAMRVGDGPAAVPPGMRLTGLYAASAAGGQRVAWLRWLPQAFEASRDGSPELASRAVWLLCRQDRLAEAQAMAGPLERSGLRPILASADAPTEAAALYAETFGRLNAPAGIIDLADGAPVFALLREWLAMHHVPSLALPLTGDALVFGSGLRRFLADVSAVAPAWRRLRPQPPGWVASGWDRVVATCGGPDQVLGGAVSSGLGVSP